MKRSMAGWIGALVFCFGGAATAGGSWSFTGNGSSQDALDGFSAAPKAASIQPGCGGLVGRDPVGGPALMVGIAGDLVVYNEGSTLVVADNSDLAAPAILGRLVLSDVPKDLVISGSYAWLAVPGSGLVAVDLSNPASPRAVSTTDVGKAPSGLDVYNGAMAGVIARDPIHGDETLALVDVSNPSSPVPLDVINISSIIGAGWYQSVQDGPWLMENHVVISAPTGNEIRPLVIPLAQPGGYSWIPVPGDHIVLAGDRLFAAGQDRNTYEYQLSIIDLGDPQQPVILGVENGVSPGPMAVEPDRGWLWVSLGPSDSWVLPIDVGDPTAPVKRDLFEIPHEGYGQGAVALAARGQILILASSLRGVHVYETNTPAIPDWRATIEVSPPAGGVVGEGDVALVKASADQWGSDRVQIFDLSDPADPRTVAEIEIEAVGFSVSDGFGYVTGTRPGSTQHGLAVFDLASPASPAEVAWVDLPGRAGVEVVGPIAYVQADQLYVYDVSDPASPTLRSTVDVNIFNLTVGDGWGAAEGGDGIVTLNMADPWNPQFVATAYHEDSGRPAIVGNTAYSISYGQLRLYDRWANIFNKLTLFESETGAVKAVGPWLVGGDDAVGVRVFDVLDPRWPLEMDAVSGPGRAVAMADIGGGRVLAGLGDAGIAVYDLSACDPHASTALLDVAASGEGSNQSQWSTDVEITNTGDEPIHVRLRYLPQDQNNSEVMFDRSRQDFAPMTTWRFKDIWGTDVGPGAGAVQIRASDPKAISVSSRTFNTSDEGTFGQGLPGLFSEQLYRNGETARIVRMSQTPGFRGNLGLVNATAKSIALNVDFFDGEGTPLGTDGVTLAPLSSTQWNRAFKRVTDEAVDVGYVDVSTTTPGGVFSAYGSVVDNATNDPTTLLALRAGSTFIAAAASAPGAQGSVWTTEVEINNAGEETVTYRLRLVPRGAAASGGVLTDELTLAPGRSVRYGDAWGEFAGEGAGSIEIVSGDADSLVVTSRTFNTGATGTFGQGMPGIRPDELFATGDTATVTQLAQTGSFRSNLVLCNGSDHPIDIVVTFYTREGVWLGESTASLLDPGSNTQWNEAFRRVTDDNINSGFVVVRTTTPGSLFYVLGSVVDKKTNDPTTILPR